MPEEKKPAEETVETTEVSDHADANKDPENVNDVEFTDGPQGNVDTEPNAEKPKGTQTKEQNSENARRRREAERQAELKKAEDAAREKTIIEILNGKNPYTGEEMKDHADVEEYLLMKEIEKKGGDPVADFSKFQKNREREKADEIAKQEREKEWYENDWKDFAAKHPEVKLETLADNKHFNKFAEGKIGKMPLSEIYESFLEFASEYEKAAQRQAAQKVANQKASPGSLSSAKPVDNGYFTREQVKAMSKEEVHQNYDKIRESMATW